jgi:hypothetical protein
MFKRRKMRFNGEWSLLAGNRVYELRIDLQISIFGFSHELLVFSIFHRENVKSESHTP